MYINKCNDQKRVVQRTVWCCASSGNMDEILITLFKEIII